MKLGRYACALALVALGFLTLTKPVAAQVVTISGDHFAVDYGSGPQPKFLLFFSYFDGMRATHLDDDLTYIKSTLKFDGIRVFPNWWLYTDNTPCPAAAGDVLFTVNGDVVGDNGSSPATGPLKKLRDLIALAAAKQLVVDVSFARETVPGLSQTNYIKAVTRVAVLLRGQRNVIFDLQNEGNLRRDEQELSTENASILRANIQHPTLGDSDRIVMASTTGSVAQALRFVGPSPAGANLPVIAYHDERVANWHLNVTGVVEALRVSGKPVYLQEPMPWSSGLTICGAQEPNQKEADADPARFRTALRAARAAGAAAWTFHTRQTFRLRDGGSLRSRFLNTPGQTLLEGGGGQAGLKDAGDEATWTPTPSTVTVAVTLAGNQQGRVTSTPSGLACGMGDTSCSTSFTRSEATVTLTATPADGDHRFAGWSGDCSGTENSCALPLNVSHAVTATFAAMPADTAVYYHLDAIGSVRAVSDSQGGTVARYDFAPFGEEVVPSSPNESLKFTGKERDTETGLDYFGGRYLQAGTGHFTSVDPVLDTTAALVAPQRWNRYAYALNNPVRLVDPDGREVPVVLNGKFYGMGSDGTSVGTVEKTNEVFRSWVGVVLAGAASPAVAVRLTTCALTAQCMGPILAAVAATAPGAPNTFPYSLKQLSAAGQALHSSGLTVVARAWSKHSASQRPGSAFPPLRGNSEHWNRVGQQMLDEILETPKKFKLSEDNALKGRDIYSLLTGRGVRYDSEGKMITFLEYELRKK